MKWILILAMQAMFLFSDVDVGQVPQGPITAAYIESSWQSLINDIYAYRKALVKANPSRYSQAPANVQDSSGTVNQEISQPQSQPTTAQEPQSQSYPVSEGGAPPSPPVNQPQQMPQPGEYPPVSSSEPSPSKPGNSNSASSMISKFLSPDLAVQPQQDTKALSGNQAGIRVNKQNVASLLNADLNGGQFVPRFDPRVGSLESSAIIGNQGASKTSGRG